MRRFLSGIVGDEEKKIFLKLTSQTLVLRLFGMALLYGNQVLMARLMGVSEYGYYTVIMTWINFLVAFSIFGFDHSALRFFSTYYNKQEWARARGFLRLSFRIIALAAVVCMIAWFLFLWDKQQSVNIRDRYPRTYSEAFLWAMFVIPLLAIIYQSSAIFRSIHQIKLSLASVYVMLPLGISIASVVYYKMNAGKMQVDGAVLMNLLVTFLVAMFIIRKMKKRLRPKYGAEEPKYEAGLWFKTTVTFLAMNVLTLIIKQADILFVGHYFGPREAGIYSTAVKISALIPFGLSIVEYVYTPRISSMFLKNDHKKLQEYISHAARIIVFITIPLAIALIFSGKYLLMIFGKEFQSSYIPLIILIVGQLINALTGMVGALMTMTGNQNVYLMVYLAASFVDIILNITLVPRMGAVGAAIASAASIIVLNIFMYVLVRKRLGLKASIF
ncbi:MAG: oligosaccharide flippase family protein [Bacteroidetes bacterium]|nr:oligosaccharide flippase family protein [Bacteroidota bacterium]